MLAGTHVCLNAVESASVFSALASQRVTHMCGAPVVLNMLIHAPKEQRVEFATARFAAECAPVRIFTAGAPPPAAVIQGVEGLGMEVTLTLTLILTLTLT